MSNPYVTEAHLDRAFPDLPTLPPTIVPLTKALSAERLALARSAGLVEWYKVIKEGRTVAMADYAYDKAELASITGIASTDTVHQQANKILELRLQLQQCLSALDEAHSFLSSETKPTDQDYAKWRAAEDISNKLLKKGL